MLAVPPIAHSGKREQRLQHQLQIKLKSLHQCHPLPSLSSAGRTLHCRIRISATSARRRWGLRKNPHGINQRDRRTGAVITVVHADQTTRTTARGNPPTRENEKQWAKQIEQDCWWRPPIIACREHRAAVSAAGREHRLLVCVNVNCRR